MASSHPLAEAERAPSTQWSRFTTAVSRTVKRNPVESAFVVIALLAGIAALVAHQEFNKDWESFRKDFNASLTTEGMIGIIAASYLGAKILLALGRTSEKSAQGRRKGAFKHYMKAYTTHLDKALMVIAALAGIAALVASQHFSKDWNNLTGFLNKTFTAEEALGIVAGGYVALRLLALGAGKAIAKAQKAYADRQLEKQEERKPLIDFHQADGGAAVAAGAAAGAAGGGGGDDSKPI